MLSAQGWHRAGAQRAFVTSYAHPGRNEIPKPAKGGIQQKHPAPPGAGLGSPSQSWQARPRQEEAFQSLHLL